MYKVEAGEFYICRILSIRQIRQNKTLTNITCYTVSAPVRVSSDKRLKGDIFLDPNCYQ